MPEQPGDVPLTYANIEKARRLLGYNPQTKIAEGIPKFVEWFSRFAAVTFVYSDVASYSSSRIRR